MSEARRPTREDRLKAALRDNLRRRKAQARGRTGPEADGAERTARDPTDHAVASKPEPRDA